MLDESVVLTDGGGQDAREDDVPLSAGYSVADGFDTSPGVDLAFVYNSAPK